MFTCTRKWQQPPTEVNGSLPHVQEVLLRFRRGRAVKDSESTVTDRDSDSGDGVEMEAIFLKGDGFVVKEKIKSFS
ncbi:hypothetical protein GOBAR_DD17472 [Gossypium barbadense]|nr:hypothetical protein GOBAR_DD17472 [Gossypium barbadense]